MLTENLIEALTFDDVLLIPSHSEILPTETETVTRLTREINLNIPVVSAAMDTVTEAPMAIAVAQQGGIGVIHKNLPIELQRDEVDKVKRSESGMIVDPVTMTPDRKIREAMAVMERYKISGVPVIAEQGRLVGILTNRDLRFETRLDLPISEVMTKENLITVPVGTTLREAEGILQRYRVEKLLVVDDNYHLKGLITVKDIQKAIKYPNAAKDQLGRLRCAAAIGATGDFLERAAELVKARVDVLAIDTAHGHSSRVIEAVKLVKRRFPELQLIAGNVGTAEGTRFLLDLGVNGIKVGIGPGGGCTTRMTTSFGVPQAQALVECRIEAGDSGVPLIADGGIRRHGALAMALMFGGDCAMLGSAFAGTEEAPGEVVHKSVVLPESQKTVKVPFKVLRGMASLEAIRDRLDVEDADQVELDAIGAEGMEISVPARGSARSIVRDMIKHLCSSISYGGAESLRDLREKFWRDPDRYLIKLSASSRRESYDR